MKKIITVILLLVSMVGNCGVVGTMVGSAVGTSVVQNDNNKSVSQTVIKGHKNKTGIYTIYCNTTCYRAGFCKNPYDDTTLNPGQFAKLLGYNYIHDTTYLIVQGSCDSCYYSIDVSY